MAQQFLIRLDDDDVSADDIKNMLENRGIKVDVAMTEEEAWDQRSLYDQPFTADGEEQIYQVRMDEHEVF